MRFLVLTTSRGAPPPEMAGALVGAMRAWMGEQRGAGRVVIDFALAGKPGGGAVIDVANHEELDEAMSGFPFAPFSDVEILPLTDLDTALDHAESTFQKMTQMMGA